jgi:hypothetical protein
LEYAQQILTPHGGILLLLMIVSTIAMSRIFSQIGDLRAQAAAIEELVPHLRASLSSGNTAKAAVAAESDGTAIGRLMAAILREPTHDSKRMRLIYKINIDGVLKERLQYISPLKAHSAIALFLGILGSASAWWFSNPDRGEARAGRGICRTGCIPVRDNFCQDPEEQGNRAE